MIRLKAVKLLLTICFSGLILLNVFGQATGDYKSVATGNWSSTSTWARWSGSAWVNPSPAPTSTAGVITIISPNNVTFDASVSIDQVTINSGGTVTINSGITMTVANGTGTDLTVSGTVINNGGTVTLVSSAIQFASGGLYQHNFSSGSAPTGTVPTATWASGSTCEILACGNSGNGPAGLTQPFWHFIWNNTTQPGPVTLLGTLSASPSVKGDLTIKSTNSNNLILVSTTAGASTTVSGSFYLINGNITILQHNSLNKSNSLTISGNYSQTGGTMIVTNVSGTVAGAPNGTLGVSGTTTISGGTLSLTTSTFVGGAGSGTLNASGLVTISGGTLNVASSSAVSSSGCTGQLNADSIIVSSGTLNVCTSTTTGSGGAGTITCTGGILISGGTVNLASGAAAVSAGCYGQVDAESIAITAGTLNLSSSLTTGGGGTGELNITMGNFTHTGGTVSKTGLNSGTININGQTGSQAIESIGFNAPNAISFIIMQSSTATATTTIAAGKNFVLNPGTSFFLNDNTAATVDLLVYGTFTANTGTWDLSDPGSSTFFYNTGVFSNNTTAAGASTASTLNFATSSKFSQVADGGFVATATWAPASLLQVTGIVSATTLGGGGQSFGKILWNSTAQTSSCDFGATGFGVKTDYTITSTGTGTLRFPDVDFTIGTTVTASPILIVQNASKLQLSNAINLSGTGNRTFTILGAVNILNTALLTVGSPNTGSGSGVADKTKNFNLIVKRNFVCSSSTPMITYDQRSFASFGDDSYTSTFTFNGATSQSVTIPFYGTNLITVSGDGTPNSGTDDEFQSNNIDNFVITNTSTTITTSAALKAKSFLIDVGTTLTLGSNILQYSLLTSSGAVDNPSTTVNGTSTSVFGTLDMGPNTLTDASGTGTFTLNNFAKLITKNAGGIAATGATGSIQVTGTRSYNASAYYKYNAAAAQVTGTGLPTPLTGTLEIANSLALATGGVTLSQLTTVSGTFALTLGKLITTSAVFITVGSAATVSPSGGSATSFVDGPIQKVGNTGFVFPTGDIAKWARIEIPATGSVTDAFTAEYVYANPQTAITPYNVSAGVNHVSYKEYWNFTRNVGTSSPTIKLYWEDGSTTTGSGISSLSTSDLHVAEYISSTWQSLSSGGTTGTTSQGTVVNSTTATLVTGTKYPFTFSAPALINILPIELLSFTGHSVNNGNQLNWATATETNNDHFELERSSDATEFVKVGTVQGNGNSTSIINYSYLDEMPLNGINYYRLKQVDFNGDFSYSNIISIDKNTIADASVQVYPNPSNDFVHILTTGNIARITIYDMLGNIVYAVPTELNKDLVEFKPLATGVYIVKSVTTDGKIITTRFVKN